MKISPKYLALALHVPGYLFSDMAFVLGERLENGRVVVNDPATPAINGVVLTGEIPDQYNPYSFFIPCDVLICRI